MSKAIPMGNKRTLAEAADVKGNLVHVGDSVAFIAYLWDPMMCTGTVTKIYSSVESDDERAKFWTTRCSVRDDNNGQIVPNVQVRRMLKLSQENK